MPGFGTRLIMFLITFHTMLYFAGAAGYLPSQTDSPHKKFVDQFRQKDKLEKGVRTDTDSSITDLSVFSPLFLLFDFIGALVGIVTSPYGLIVNSPLPLMLKWVAGGILALLEVASMASFIRGYSL